MAGLKHAIGQVIGRVRAFDWAMATVPVVQCTPAGPEWRFGVAFSGPGCPQARKTVACQGHLAGLKHAIGQGTGRDPAGQGTLYPSAQGRKIVACQGHLAGIKHPIGRDSGRPGAFDGARATALVVQIAPTGPGVAIGVALNGPGSPRSGKPLPAQDIWQA